MKAARIDAATNAIIGITEIVVDPTARIADLGRGWSGRSDEEGCNNQAEGSHQIHLLGRAKTVSWSLSIGVARKLPPVEMIATYCRPATE